MNIEVNQTYAFFAKVESFNIGDHFANMTLARSDQTKVNVKFNPHDKNSFELGKVYYFEVIGTENNERLQLLLVHAESIYSRIHDAALLEAELSRYYDYAPTEMTDVQSQIEKALSELENPVIATLTKDVYRKFERDFYVYPAATKFHHAYIGGLAYHTATMLSLVNPFVKTYPFLNKDLLIAGIILHDMGKIMEFSGAEGGEYTKEGQMIGHLAMGVVELDRVALKAGLEETEELLLLKHIVLSHHGQLHFGSPKKPMLPEALLIWFIDSIDSKLTVIGEELDKTAMGDFTQMIGVADRGRFYKPDLPKTKQ